MLLKNENHWIVGVEMMNKPDKDSKQENTPDKRCEEKERPVSENKPSRLAERKGQRPAFPFRRKPV